MSQAGPSGEQFNFPKQQQQQQQMADYQGNLLFVHQVVLAINIIVPIDPPRPAVVVLLGTEKNRPTIVKYIGLSNNF